MRPWVLLAMVVFLLVGCSQKSTPPEQPEKESVEEAEKHSAKEPTGEEAAGATTAQVSQSREQSPKEVLASQYRYINAGDYQAAYELFDEQSQQVVSQEQYEANFHNNAPYSIDEYSFPSVEVSDDAASVTADLIVSSSTGEDSYQVTQGLVREDGSWRVVVRDEQPAAFSGTGSASASSSPEVYGDNYDATVTVSRVVDAPKCVWWDGRKRLLSCRA